MGCTHSLLFSNSKVSGLAVELSLGGGDGNGAATVGARSEPKEPRSAGDGNFSTVVLSGSECRRAEISPETIKVGRK